MESHNVCTHWMYQCKVLYLAWWWLNESKQVAEFWYWLPIYVVFIDWIIYYIIAKHNEMAPIKKKVQLIDKLSRSSCSLCYFRWFWCWSIVASVARFLHILLNQMAAFVFSNFSLVFLSLLQIFDCWASIILTFVPCIFFICIMNQQKPTDFHILLNQTAAFVFSNFNLVF